MSRKVGPMAKVGYSLMGLFAGDIVMLAYLLASYIVHQIFLSFPTGGLLLQQVFRGTLTATLLFGVFSTLGWGMAGLPFVLLLHAEFVSRLRWLSAILMGIVLGPTALLLIFLLLFAVGAHLNTDRLQEIKPLLVCSILVSTVAFVVYCALVRRAMRRSEGA